MAWINGRQNQRIGSPPIVGVGQNLNPDPRELQSQLAQLNNYLKDIATVLNSLPRISIFSGVTPNSVISGLPGDLLVNVGSASTTSRLWIKAGGTSTVPTNTGWAVVRVLE